MSGATMKLGNSNTYSTSEQSDATSIFARTKKSGQSLATDAFGNSSIIPALTL
jgi:hypothetical protein